MSSAVQFDARETLRNILSYLVLGLVVSTSAFFINGKNTDISYIVLLGLIAAATISLLDLVSPRMGSYARAGASGVIGANLVGGLNTSNPAPVMQ